MRWSDLWLFLALAMATMLAVLERRDENSFRLCPFCSTEQETKANQAEATEPSLTSQRSLKKVLQIKDFHQGFMASSFKVLDLQKFSILKNHKN